MFCIAIYPARNSVSWIVQIFSSIALMSIYSVYHSYVQLEFLASIKYALLLQYQGRNDKFVVKCAQLQRRILLFLVCAGDAAKKR